MLDLVLHGGVVLTQAREDFVAKPTAVGIRAGRVALVGDDQTVLRAAGPATERVHVGGRTIVPGFNDAHAHIWKIGHLLTTMVDLRGVETLGALIDAVRRAADRRPPGAWILGRGYNEAVLLERRPPTRDDLDSAAPGRAVVLTRTCGHIYSVSSRALEQAGIDATTEPPAGGIVEHDEDGQPNGLLHETAMGLINRVMPQPTQGDYEAMITAALRHQLMFGITSSADCGVSPQLLSVYRSMDADGALPSRINVMPLRLPDGAARAVPLPEAFVSDVLRVDTVKFLADGGLSGATAALSVPYRHQDTRGVLRFSTDSLRGLCAESHHAGWRIATHAIGDVAIDQVLEVYESLGPHPRGLAHRIEHFGLPSAAQLARAARLGVIAAPQTIFIKELGRNFKSYLPQAFFSRTYPVRAMLDAGVRVALSSDAPVVEDDNPLSGMAAAITRRDADGDLISPLEAISAAEALYAYTMGGAIATGDEMNRGSIEAGKWADLAVLSGNPLEESPERLPRLTVDMTLVAGRVAFER